MTVRNEAKVIARALASVRPYIDHWVIVDTGSTDGTQAIVRECLQGIPGGLFQRDWENYGVNSDDLIRFAYGHGDYVWILDADEEVTAEGDPREHLGTDAHFVRVRQSILEFDRLRILRLGLPWEHRAIRHAVPTLTTGAPTTSRVPGVLVLNHNDGNRGTLTKEERRARFERDIPHFQGLLAKNPNDARSAFYLAQSFKDAGQFREAADAYQRRADMGGWGEEVYYSLLQVAVLRGRLGDPPAEVQDAYLRAYRSRPSRSEALVYLALYCLKVREATAALQFAKQATSIARPEDRLFLDWRCYSWLPWRVTAQAAFERGDFQLAVEAGERTLMDPDLTDAEREEFRGDLYLARAKRNVARDQRAGLPARAS